MTMPDGSPRFRPCICHLKVRAAPRPLAAFREKVQSYGFGSLDTSGSVYVVMNPAQDVQTLKLPLLSKVQPPITGGYILFRDAGFVPVLTGDSIKLGPGQMAVIGFGKYASKSFNLGIQEDVRIPSSIEPIKSAFVAKKKNTIEATIPAPQHGDLRIIMRQRSADGNIMRSWKGGPPNGTNMGKVFVLRAWQGDRELPVEINYDKVIWSGLSWAVGEVKHTSFKQSVPIRIQCSSNEESPVVLDGQLFEVGD